MTFFKKQGSQLTLQKIETQQWHHCRNKRQTIYFSWALTAEKYYQSLFSNRLEYIIIMENKHFLNIITHVDSNQEFQEELITMNRRYLIQLYKISELNAKNITELYQALQKKFYLNRQAPKVQYWYQNELRIFIWLYFAYLYAFRKEQKNLRDEDWNYFSNIFNHKSPIFFQFQVKSIMKPETRSSSWSIDETQLLKQIIEQQSQKNHWNNIARELFIRSSKRFFRNPKQCRQKWMNHLDPSKIHTEWSINQDIVLLNTIKKRGKRWSLAVKELNHSRTEHMVKNRYKSLILNQSKKYPDKKECFLENNLIKRLYKQLSKEEKTEKIPIKESKELQDESLHENIKQCLEQKNCSLPKNSQINAEIIEDIINNHQIQDDQVKQEHEALIFQHFNPDEGLKINSPIFTPLKGEFSSNRISFESEDQNYFIDRVYECQSFENQDYLRI